MAVNLDAILRISAKSDTRELEKLRNSLQSVDKAGEDTKLSISGIGSGLVGMAGAIGGGALMGKIFGDTATLEKQTKSLEVLLGSATKAKGIIEELRAYGSVTPFEATDLIETAKKLTAFGVEGDRVVEVTKRLGDVAGATGADLNELATVYGQVVAKGKLQTEELIQFQERGVGIQGELQRMYGLSGEQLQKALSTGKISAEAFEIAIVNLTSKGGKYANGAVAQSDTLFGKMSTLQDVFTAISQQIGSSLEPTVKGAITSLTKLGEGIGVVLSENREPIKQAIEGIGAIGKSLGPWVIGIGLVVGAYKLLTGAIQAAAIAQATLQGLSGPKGWAMLAAGIGATAIVVNQINKTFEELEAKTNGTASAINGLADAAGKLPPPLEDANKKAEELKRKQEEARQKIEEAKAAQEAFKFAVDQSNFSYDLLKATIQATFQEVELINELAAAEYDANISINNSAKSILETKMRMTDNDYEKIALAEEIMQLEIANAGFQKKAAEAQIAQEINIADLKRRQLWTDLRRADAALAIARAEGRATQEMVNALELAKQAANSADQEYRFTQQVAEQKERAAGAAYDAAVFNARAGLQTARMAAAERERTRQQQARERSQRQAEDQASQMQRATGARGVFEPRGGGGGGGGGNPWAALLGPRPAFYAPAPSSSAPMGSASVSFSPQSQARGGRGNGGGRSVVVQTGPVMQMPDGSQWVSKADLERGMATVADEVLNIVASPAGRMALGGA